jgi:hypothetical protein
MRRTIARFFVICGLSVIAIVNTQPWHMLGAAVESKVGVLLTLSDMGNLPILGWFFTLLSLNCKFIVTYGLFTVCTWLQVSLLIQGRNANPGLVISAACSLILELAINFIEYPPIQLTEETWDKILLGEPIAIDWVCIGILLIGCLSLDWSIKTFWFDGIPPSPQGINSARHRRKQSIKDNKASQQQQPTTQATQTPQTP